MDLVRDRQISYGVVQPGNDSESGIPIVRVKDVRNGTIDTSSPMRVGKDIALKHSRTALVGGELLLSLVGTVGESAVAPNTLAGWNVARAIAVIRPIQVSARWLQLCFESAPIRSEILGLLNTTVQSTLNLADLKRLRIPVPPAEIRAGIEDVLGALDDKIAANTKLLSGVDALAHAIFQSMMEEAELLPLSSTAQFVNGKAFTKGASGTGRVVIRIAELNSGIGGSTVYSDAEVSDQHIANPGDLLFAWSGSLTRLFKVPGECSAEMIAHAAIRAALLKRIRDL
ncbi:restriction endonuclease subunit S [Arthrobacter sp. UYCu723]